MSSSPRTSVLPASVKAFEYPESGTSKTAIGKTSNPQNINPAGPEMQRLLADARAQGIQEGLQQAQQNEANHESQELTRVSEALRNFQQQVSDYYGRVEVELVHLSLSIAAKILHREAQVDRMLVAALAKIALEKLQQGTKVTVHVNPDEAAAWKDYLAKSLSGWMNIEVESDAKVASHDCILETELGETELGIESQLKEIELGFFDLLAQRPGSK